MMPENWEPAEECRIGSLPWFAGITWLAISYLLTGLGRLAFKAYCYRVAYVMIVLSNKADSTLTNSFWSFYLPKGHPVS